MDQTFLLIVLIMVVTGFGVVLYVLNQKLRELKNSSAVELLKSDVTELSRGINNLQQTVGDKLDHNNTTMQKPCNPGFLTQNGSPTNKVRLCERSEPQSNRLLDKPGLDEVSSWFLMEIAF